MIISDSPSESFFKKAIGTCRIKSMNKYTARLFLIGVFALLVVSVSLIFFNKSNPLQLISDIVQTGEIDTLEFAPGYPQPQISALAQLEHFPAPQFKSNHKLLRNFLWMDPAYLSGLLQPNYKMNDCVALSTQIQAQLAQRWHYYFLVSNNLKSYKSYRNTNTFTGNWVAYANSHPEIPCAAISFWAQVQPFVARNNCTGKWPFVNNQQLPDSCYIHNNNELVLANNRKRPSPLTPVSALKCDFETQTIYIDSLLSALKRPLQLINENGEVFTLYNEKLMEGDLRIKADKEKYPNINWNQYQALKRLEKEWAFRNSFMQKKQLENCLYTEYSIDGNNNFRHDYATMRVVNSKINNQYYSTPDFYPRHPDNWKTWKGPWHGLKWLQVCRKTELALGDNLFSPFVAAGWDSVEVKNIRPAQWLGLLKVVSNMGAEFFYSGFFNTGKQVAIPANYVWQATTPVYAQAITSFFEDILRDSKMINQEDFIDYPDPDVPVVVRKSNQAKIWIIACSWQTGTSYNKGTPLEKTVSVNLGHKTLKVQARRQGSVYYYSETGKQPLFYQFDGWHEYKHPYFWSKNIVLEAELYGKEKITLSKSPTDYTTFTTLTALHDSLHIPFECSSTASKVKKIHIWLKNNAVKNSLDLYFNYIKVGQLPIKHEDKIVKYTIELPTESSIEKLKQILTVKTQQDGVWIDKLELVME